MSYILEALKKLEKERKRGRIPGLSEQDSVVYHSQRRPVWPYLLAGAFILNAVILIWWFLPKNTKDAEMPAAPSSLQLAAPSILPATAPAPSQDTTRPENRESGNVITKGAAGLSSVKPAPVMPPAHDAVSRESVQPVRNVPREEDKKAVSVRKSEPKTENDKQKKTEILRQETKPEITAEPLPEKKLYKLSELPPSVRDSLPRFSITAFLYADSPSGRMARINERMMREGQELEPGIRIEEIVPDGVVMSYRKFRFFVSLK